MMPLREITIPPRDRRRFTRLVRDVRACEACDAMTHSHVLGADNGRLDAPVLFVAEAVGRRGGAVTGVPLTRDESGRRFSAFLALAGISRADVFVTNAVLCNPTDARGRNRPPTASECARCRPFLARTLELVRAPLLVTLGRVALEATRAVEPHEAELARDVATPVSWRGRTLVPLYHPGRQSTLHRPQAAQEGDWRALGALVPATAAAGDQDRNPVQRR
ncbi:MAG: uracil-DNA glycosylase [Dehalococcoidia bacterium]|nr:uracil-DNA glycosylase [Dehalococcoidia bacterium]